jgi:F0F1-type ATP synthase assembly protein I
MQDSRLTTKTRKHQETICVQDSGRQKQRDWRNIGIALSAGWIVAASIGVSVLVGLGLDHLFHTRPVFLVVMFLIGVVAGLYNLIRELRRME